MTFSIETINWNNIERKGTIQPFVNDVLRGLNKGSGFGYREIEILENLESIERNYNVPNGYYILRFFHKDGNIFEAGMTPNGYKITN